LVVPSNLVDWQLLLHDDNSISNVGVIMEYAVYFLGFSLLVLAGVVVWGISVAKRTVSDIQTTVDKLPEIVAHVNGIVSDVKTVSATVGDLVADIKSIIPGTDEGASMDNVWKGAGEGGAQVLKSLAGSLFKAKHSGPEIDGSLG
jgi:hypothetical protein